MWKNLQRIETAIAIGVLCGSALSQPARAQAFDVASIKPSPPPGSPNRVGYVGGPRNFPGRAVYDNIPLKYLTMVAYGLTANWRIDGGPSWFDKDNFDIEATFPLTTPREQIPAMLRTLLADRFKLATHLETKEHPVYALIAGSGLKIKESAVDDTPMRNTMGTAHMELHKVTMQRLADLLSGTTLTMSDRPVVDMTGLKGVYDLTLDWAPDDAPADSGKPSLFTAVSEQLGLRLEAQRAPVEFLVVDHAEKPSEN